MRGKAKAGALLCKLKVGDTRLELELEMAGNPYIFLGILLKRNLTFTPLQCISNPLIPVVQHCSEFAYLPTQQTLLCSVVICYSGITAPAAVLVLLSHCWSGSFSQPIMMCFNSGHWPLWVSALLEYVLGIAGGCRSHFWHSPLRHGWWHRWTSTLTVSVCWWYLFSLSDSQGFYGPALEP